MKKVPNYDYTSLGTPLIEPPAVSFTLLGGCRSRPGILIFLSLNRFSAKSEGWIPKLKLKRDLE